MFYCDVCLDGPVIQGFWFCEACRSFLRRNRRKSSSISCDTGFNQCLASVEEKTRNKKSTKICNNNNNSSSSKKHRKLCKGCRLEKCLQLETKTKVIRPLENEFEKTLSKIVHASTMFQMDLKQLQYRIESNQLPFSIAEDYAGICAIYLDSLRDQISMMKQFAKAFPIFSNMNIQDRVTFFRSTQFRAIVAEGFINDNDFYIGCFSGQNWLLISKWVKGPVASLFAPITSQTLRIWQSIKALKLDQTEKYFLLAFLFFHSKFPVFFLYQS